MGGIGTWEYLGDGRSIQAQQAQQSQLAQLEYMQRLQMQQTQFALSPPLLVQSNQKLQVVDIDDDRISVPHEDWQAWQKFRRAPWWKRLALALFIR